MQRDRKRDVIHLNAPKGWINDPNGFIYYKGKYHLFYQFFPYATRWATMHWGHAISDDLVSWEHLGVALFPTIYEDQNGCFSGSAVECAGNMHLFYTGAHYDKVNAKDIHLCRDDAFTATQLSIVSEDGFHFDNFCGKQVVIPAITDAKIGDSTHARDPKVWRGKDAWHMVIGSTTMDHKGELVFYRSEDLSDWAFVNVAALDETYGWMWECPDYFKTEGGEVLVVSPMGWKDPDLQETNQTICMTVSFDEQTSKLQFLGQWQYLDYGHDLYAPQSTLDAEGRRVLIAWLRMPMPVDDSWIGMFCIPRVVEVHDGHIYFRVHPNVEHQFSNKISDISQSATEDYRISIDLAEGELINIGGYRIMRKEGRICTDRKAVFPENPNFQIQSQTPPIQDGNHVDVYVNEHLIEVFVNYGEYVISHAVYGLRNEITTDAVCQPDIYTLNE